MRCCILALAVLALQPSGVLAQTNTSTTGTAAPSPAEPNPLLEKLTGYFQATSARDRAKALHDISALPDADIAHVAQALKQIALWKAVEPGEKQIRIAMLRASTRTAEEIGVSVRVPQGYDPTAAWPAILVLPDPDASAVDDVAKLLTSWGVDPDKYLIAVAPRLGGVWLSSPVDTAEDPLRLVDTLGRQFHLDADRVYLVGTGANAHAACVLSALLPDLFAASVSIHGTLALQMPPAATAEMFLPNLRTVRSLWVFPSSEDVGSVASWNRYLSEKAAESGIPLDAFEVAGEDGTLLPPPDKLQPLLETRRPAGAKQLSLWFRYPAHGRIGWLKQTGFDGEPWTAQQLLVAPAPTEDVGVAAAALLKQKFAFLAGEIEGQTIRITSRRCDRIELRLSAELVDLDQPVTIFLDGTKRFDGKVKPKLATLLECARADWDFQRLWPVRMTISAKGRASEE
jgi:hypothetical protein